MSRDFILGYGSLLSDHSRRTYSDLTEPVSPVVVQGWRRGWTTRYRDEAATYAGVREDRAGELRAVLVPGEVTDELRHRERGYAFTPVEPDRIVAESALPEGRFWIVVNHEQLPPDADHPLPQTYVDTCLIGALESGGDDHARAFIRSTEHWSSDWVNDRDFETPLYPRLTRADLSLRARIDALLRDEGLLALRQLASGREK